ncbi:MAG: hypothetical protein COA63_010645 [Methylophaga sp.]|nr:hypothetical protein [Methylophaga sp.]
MEPRNYEAGAAGSAPVKPVSPSSGYPTDGNPQTATPATKPGAHWFYKIGESLRNVIEGAGLTPDDDDLTQLKQAITLSASAVAAQAETDAGVIDNKYISPKKLRWGFSSLLAANGYIVFPTWLGGLIIQWGTYTTTLEGTYTTNLPIVFPNAFLLPLATIKATTNTAGGIQSAAASIVSSSTIRLIADTYIAGSIDGIFYIAIGH